MSNNLRDMALQLAAVTLVADLAKDERDRIRAEFVHALNDAGADSTRAEIDGERIAKVTLVQPSAKPSVINEDAFTKHVAAMRPDEIVSKVRESYRKVYLDSLIATDDGDAIDPDTGEVVNGVRFAVSGGYVSTRFEKQGRERLGAAIKAGQVSYYLPEPPTAEITGSEA